MYGIGVISFFILSTFFADRFVDLQDDECVAGAMLVNEEKVPKVSPFPHFFHMRRQRTDGLQAIVVCADLQDRAIVESVSKTIFACIVFRSHARFTFRSEKVLLM
jgi:hypothetical protein